MAKLTSATLEDVYNNVRITTIMLTLLYHFLTIMLARHLPLQGPPDGHKLCQKGVVADDVFIVHEIYHFRLQTK